VLLGVFILFELIYLPAANVIKLVPLRLPESRGELDDDIQLRGKAYVEPVQRALDGLGAAMCRWGELTGQAQGWSLFAPLFGHQASLPSVWMSPETLNSPFLPDDPNFYFRWPSPRCRLFNYEYRLTLLYWTWSEESERDRPEEWRKAAVDRVRRQNRSMLAYLRWRTAPYFTALPSVPPNLTVTLWAELVPSPPPADPSAMRKPPDSQMLARWLPGQVSPSGWLPVQAFDHGWTWLCEEE
jgi:hypothetical protein